MSDGKQPTKEQTDAWRNREAQTWKRSRPENVGGMWRIRRHDGELVGYYASRELAQREILKRGYLQ